MNTSALVNIEDARPQQIATWTPTFAVSTTEMKARVAAKRDFYKNVMDEGQHYGLPPGMDKKRADGTAARPALLKPGAELLLSSMGLFAELSDAERPIRDYDGSQNGGEALIAYRRVCRIYRQTGPTESERVRVVQAEGFCSSRETKYRYREGGRKCPECGSVSIIKGKIFDDGSGGGWFCFPKKGGCGEKFLIDDNRIVSQQLGRVANPDIADQENTILKMADKRAYVAATLLATGCSDIFTQDIEDDPNLQEPKNVTPRGNGRREEASSSPVDLISDRQLQTIEKMWAHLSQQDRLALVAKATDGKIRDIGKTTVAQATAVYQELKKIQPPRSAAPPAAQEQTAEVLPPEEAPQSQEDAQEAALVQELDEISQPKPQVAPQVKIDPKIIEEFRGMRAVIDIQVLCDSASQAGLTGMQLRDIVKKATNGEVLTKPTYDEVFRVVEELKKRKTA